MGFNQTTLIVCPPAIDMYIHNLTSSYTEKSNEAGMVSASVIMFVLAGLFFNLNLFSGISDVSATLDPKVRLFLSSALSLLLPVMSYLFSEAKNSAAASSTPMTSAAASSTPTTSSTPAAATTELSLGAMVILAWMVLVELLRKKVDEIRMRGFSGSIQRAGRVVWLGSLIFFNIKTAGRKAVFSILWIICATRVVQRIAYTEIGKYSYAHGKNARLINSYMAKILLKQEHHHQAAVQSNASDAEQDVKVHDGQELLKSCRYIVMGEEKLVQEPTADGYSLNMTSLDDDGDGGSVVTVGKVWKLDENNSSLFTSPDQVQRLKRLCLSFALFKLLRRKFEHLPAVTGEEEQDCRDLIFKGLLRSNSNGGIAAEELFQVINDEVIFLSEYYHSVVPVVLASPFFLLVNYFLVLLVVAVLCVMTIILCGNGDVVYAFWSIGADNYTLHSGIGKVAVCLLLKARNSPEAFFSIVDISVTLLLFIIYFYEEIWEFFVFILSNWFMVSLVCSYMAKPQWCGGHPVLRYAVHRIIWLRSKLNHGSLSVRQFSVLNLHWPLGLQLYSPFSLVLRKEMVPKNLKQSIMDCLLEHEHCTGTAFYTPLTNGKAALQRNYLFDKLSWACQSDSVSEVFLTWHIATCILEVECHEQQEGSSSRAAIRLSKYCAYLVAFHPELLPDNPEKAERVVEDMKAEFSAIFSFWEYYLCSQRARVKKIMAAAAGASGESDRDQNGVVRNGARLGRMLVDVAGNHGAETAWKAVADVWTELIVFVAPSGEEERVKGHGDVLVQGGEFITVLWALTTHIGLSREANNSSKPAKTLEDLMAESMRALPVVASMETSMV
jgi:hypothetical protein